MCNGDCECSENMHHIFFEVENNSESCSGMGQRELVNMVNSRKTTEHCRDAVRGEKKGAADKRGGSNP